MNIYRERYNIHTSREREGVRDIQRCYMGTKRTPMQFSIAIYHRTAKHITLSLTRKLLWGFGWEGHVCWKAISHPLIIISRRVPLEIGFDVQKYILSFSWGYSVINPPRTLPHPFPEVEVGGRGGMD